MKFSYAIRIDKYLCVMHSKSTEDRRSRKGQTMSEQAADVESERPFAELEPLGKVSVAPAHGIASIALHMAMKYHDMNMVHDGTLYQQYKLEGRNMMPLHLDRVFETAIKIEMHLLGASDRIAKLVVDAITFGIENDPQEDDTGAPDSEAHVT